MTAKELSNLLKLEVLSMPSPDKEIKSVYAGDLLSWVMGRAEEGCAWATIMTNINVVAVASLVGASMTVVCEDSEISDDVISVALEKSVNLFRTKLSIYEFCVKISGLI